MALVVAVHGIGQRRSGAERLRALWLDAANAGLDAAERPPLRTGQFGLAYYADAFRKPWPLLGDDQDAEPMTDDEAQWVEAALADLVNEAEYDENLQGDLGIPAAPAWLTRRMVSVDRLFGPRAGRLVVRVLREVYAYLYKDDLASIIREKVQATLSMKTELLIGHSLGSVIAYDMLRRGTIKAKALVTIGSPLGWPTILAALGGSLDGRVTPQWNNLYDPSDVVTAGRALSRYDENIRDHRVDNGWQDAHGAVRYLANAATGLVLADSVQ